MTQVLRGVNISPGIGRGMCVLWTPQVVAIPLELEHQEVVHEIERLETAFKESRRQLHELKDQMEQTLGAEHAYLVEAQLHLLSDPSMLDRARELIENHKTNAEWALELLIKEIAGRFEQIADPYLRERLADVEDALRRVQANLAGYEPYALEDIRGPVVLVAQDVAPSNLLEWVQNTRLNGLILERASSTSHAAILARSIGIPAVGGLPDIFQSFSSGREVLVDGYDGTVILEPTPLQIREYESKRRYFVQHLEVLSREFRGPAVTQDGFEVRLLANLEFVEETESARKYEAEGIGLFRSEYLYLNRPGRLPTEEEHFQAYQKLVEQFTGRPVVIRLADLGAEKLPAHHDLQGNNPAMGLRALRLGLRRREILDPQIRALLRVANQGDVRILVPFVATAEEVVEVIELIEENRQRLTREGIPHRPDPPLGIMVEIPSVAYILEHLRTYIDFVSIGTNDLIQFLLAVDRDHQQLRYLYKPFHPSVLRVLDEIISVAQANHLGVNVCGEMAADIPSVILLVGLGCPELSMVPQWIPVIRFLIRAIRFDEAQRLAREALHMAMGKQVEEYLLEWIQSRFPEGIFRDLLRRVNRTESFRVHPAPD